MLATEVDHGCANVHGRATGFIFDRKPVGWLEEMQRVNARAFPRLLTRIKRAEEWNASTSGHGHLQSTQKALTAYTNIQALRPYTCLTLGCKTEILCSAASLPYLLTLLTSK